MGFQTHRFCHFVDKAEVLLIFPKSKEQDIKETLQRVKDNFGDQFI